MADRVTELGLIYLAADGGALSEDGIAFLHTLGVEIDGLVTRAGRRARSTATHAAPDCSRPSHIAFTYLK
jgi:hypothetical protein